MQEFDAIKILEESNKLLLGQIEKLYSNIDNIPEEKNPYMLLDYCLREYEACELAIACLKERVLRNKGFQVGSLAEYYDAYKIPEEMRKAEYNRLK